MTLRSSRHYAGVKNGLELTLNVEQYQYTKGPHNAVGLKFLLHRQDEVPLVQNFGDNVPVGMYTFVAVNLLNVSKYLICNCSVFGLPVVGHLTVKHSLLRLVVF